MNEMQIFQNEQFGQIRTVRQDEEILFVAIDVCNALGLSNSRKAVSRLDDDEKASVTLSDGSQNRHKTAVNEYGLYNLVLSSRKPEAKAFKRWITHEVIPAIRKTGSYSVQTYEDDPQVLKAMRTETQLNNSRARVAALYIKISEHAKEPIAFLKQAVRILQGSTESSYPRLLASRPATNLQRTYTATDIAAIFGVSKALIGRIANLNGLKTERYGKWINYQRASGSTDKVFIYYEDAITEFYKLLKR